MSQSPSPQQPNPYGQAPGQPYPPQPPAKQKKKWYKRPIVWILAVIVVIAIAVNGANGGNDKAASSTAPDSTTSEAAEPRTPMSVTAATMIDDLESNALKAETTYKGQYVEVTGYVSNIDAQGKYFSVDGGPDTFTFTNVQAFITPEQQAQVAEFSKGNQVVFTGEVTDVGEVMGYSIDVESIQ